ncbi:MAG: peptidyl-prolyl cis-trans isomerase [Deltaproteobacteria bacterium]|nr:peptidyl-prolyl cis-trans isomerase [Deltaproteobacteria bacterium]
MKPVGVDLRQAKLVLDRMIDGVIVHRALQRANLRVTDTEVDASLKQLGVATAPVAGVKPDPGIDIPLLQEQMRDRLELQKLAASQAQLEVTEQEVDAELAAGAPGIDRGQGVRVEGWLFRLSPTADAAAQAKAEQAAQELAKAVPAQQPEHVAKQLGLTAVPPFLVGDHGLEADLEAAAAALAKGQLSGPIKTKVGWMVIRMLERVEGTKLDDKALRARVRKALETRKAAAAGKDVMTKLRNAATIEIFVDLG